MNSRVLEVVVIVMGMGTIPYSNVTILSYINICHFHQQQIVLVYYLIKFYTLLQI